VARRVVIVNADDFGQSAGVNRGVILAHEEGVVTSASLMVRHAAAREAAAYARQNRRLSVGLHVDLGEWTCRNGEWIALYDVLPLDDAEMVGEEIARQLDIFRQLLGHDPTHLDSHQYVHLRPLVRPVIAPLAEHLSVPLRNVTPQVRYCGEFYGQTAGGTPLPEALTAEHLMALLRALPSGLTELGCHPGFCDDLVTMYRAERREELKALCDPLVREALDALGIELRSFAEVRDEAAPRV
jgi:chitin disaccharide deacetylase